jgi:ribosomal protein S18 acetylase RimI-like enzyme
MRHEVTRDRSVLERALRRHAGVHLYEIGDLDDDFFDHTTYHVALDRDDRVLATVAVYDGGGEPTLMALAGDATEASALTELVPRVVRAVGVPVYAHISPELQAVVEALGAVEPRGSHERHLWTDRRPAFAVDRTGCAPLGPADAAEVLALLDREYPGHFFHPRVLSCDAAWGFRDAGRLVAFAGVHVLSRRHRVAALGNVVTAASHRGRGLASRVCAALVVGLAEDADAIGLNVDGDNAAAKRVYERLGFAYLAPYRELVLTPRADG